MLMRNTLTVAITALMFVSLAVLSTTVQATADTGYSMSVVKELPEDTNGDGRFDYLSLTVMVTVAESGHYSILGSIKNSGGIRAVATDDLHSGTNNMTIRFSGQEIYNRGLEGSFDILFYLTHGSNEMCSITYQTKEYSKDYFNPNISPKGTMENGVSLHLEKNVVAIEGKTFSATIRTDRPEVIYFYTGTNDLKFSVLFTEIVFYNDNNNNGHYDKGEETAVGDLSDGKWGAVIDLIEGYNKFDFSITGSLSIDGKPVEIIFHYSSAMRTIDGFGRQKFDIDIRPDGISANRIALFQTVSVVSGSGTVSAMESHKDGYYTYLLDSNNNRVGYYSFANTASLYQDDFGVEPIKINVTGYETGNKTQVIDYEYQKLMYIHHDPEIALDPSFAPQLIKKTVKIFRNNPLLFLSTALVCTVLITINIKSFKKKN